MGLFIHLHQMLKIEMRVYLCSADITVSEQFLDGAKVLTGLQHMTGKAVTQTVRIHPPLSSHILTPEGQP